MAWKGVEGVRTPPTQRTFTYIKSKRLSGDREGQSLVPMVCGLAIMYSHGCLAHPPTLLRASAADISKKPFFVVELGELLELIELR